MIFEIALFLTNCAIMLIELVNGTTTRVNLCKNSGKNYFYSQQQSN